MFVSQVFKSLDVQSMCYDPKSSTTLYQSVVNGFYNYSLGLVKDSSDPLEFGWKIVRFEVCFQKFIDCVNDYLKKSEFTSLESMIANTDRTSLPEWQQHVIKIFTPALKDLSGPEWVFTKDHWKLLEEDYRTSITRLREASAWANSHCDAEDSIHIFSIVYLYFQSIEINELCQKILERFVGPRSESSSMSGQIDESDRWSENLKQIHRKLSDAPAGLKSPKTSIWAKSIKDSCGGLLWWPFDPSLDGNLCHRLYRIIITQAADSYSSNNHESTAFAVNALAMGTATIQLGRDIKLDDEFIANLNEFKRRGRNYLYFNHQSYKPTSRWFGDESERCDVLHSCEEKFPGVCTVVTFSYNSRFYNQSDKPDVDVQAELFMDTCFKEFFERPYSESGQRISKTTIDSMDLKRWTKEVLKKMHRILFSSRDKLNVLERKVFIRIFYFLLRQNLMIKQRSHSFNHSCKDGIDRAAETNAETLLILAVLNQVASDPKVLKLHEVILNIRSILVRKRPIREERLERTLETGKFILAHQENVCELMAEVFPGIKITVDVFNSLM